MTRVSRVAGARRLRLRRGILPQIGISVAATALAVVLIAEIRPEDREPAPPAATAEQRAPAAIPVARLWPRQTDPTRLFALSLEVAPAASAPVIATRVPVAAAAQPKPQIIKPQIIMAKAGPKAGEAKHRRPVLAAADVLPPPRPASLASAEAAPSEPAESPRLFGVKLPGSVARVGGTVVTTVASLGERIWDQLP
jgi:hypothetical protein